MSSDDHTPASTAPDGVQLADGERFIGGLEALNGHRFALTSQRVSYESTQDWSFAFLTGITAVRIVSQPRDRRSLFWGIVGALAALGVWQIATNGTVALAGGLVVAAVSALLLGDYFIRAPDLRLELQAGAFGLAGPVRRARAGEAREFARLILQARSNSGGHSAPVAPRPSVPPPPPRYPVV